MNFLISLNKFKNHLFKKENIYFCIFAIIIFCLDRFSKLQVINNLNEAPYYVNNFINFDLIWNIGVGFGLLSTNSSFLYNIVTVLIGIVILCLIYFFVISNKLDKFIFSIIVGGALGNFYDRLVYRAVPDFVDLHYDNFHWFTFNVADIFITLGILIFIVRGFSGKNLR